jgi:type I restriction enzyme S subunit
MLQIEARHLLLLQAILRKYPYQFFVYGSRAKGTASKFSDLDLCIKGPASTQELGTIRAAFEESNLPFKVDVILWDTISKEFKQKIAADLRPLEQP